MCNAYASHNQSIARRYLPIEAQIFYHPRALRESLPDHSRIRATTSLDVFGRQVAYLGLCFRVLLNAKSGHRNKKTFRNPFYIATFTRKMSSKYHGQHNGKDNVRAPLSYGIYS